MFFQKIKLMKKWKFWFAKVLIRNEVFHNELNERIESNCSLALVKGHLCLTKEHLDNPERQMEFEYPPNEKLFLISFISKKALLTKCPISGPFIFLKQALMFIINVYYTKSKRF